MASRFEIANSIREASLGDSIMSDIEASIKSASSDSTGQGAATSARYLSDTADKVSTMRKRALGARSESGITTDDSTVVVDKMAGIARDWMTSMLGDEDSNISTVSEPETSAEEPVKSKVLPVSNTKGLGSRPSSASKDESTIEFIAGFENVPQDSFKAYWDNDHWSIGFGTRASGEDEVITLEQAQDRLANETSKFQGVVEKHMKKHKYKWNANQVAALTSFTFNLGETNLNNLTENGNRDVSEILKMIPSYNKADGKELKGLVERRRSEADLFSTQP